MRRVLCAIVLTTLLSPGHSLSQEHTLSISPLLSYNSFRSSGFDNGLDFGAAAEFQAAPSLLLTVSTAFGSRALTFDVIGGTQTLEARVFTAAGGIEYAFLGQPGGARLAATFGAGRISIAVESHTVSLGALGSVTIPERTSARGFLQGGLSGVLPLSGRIAVVIQPALRFISPLSGSHDFSVSGGLRVGIL